jgi:hypothetical protein
VRRVVHAAVLFLLLLTSTVCTYTGSNRAASRQGDGCDLTFEGSDRKAVKLRPANLDYEFLNGGRPISMADFYATVCPMDERVPERRRDVPQAEPLPEEMLRIKLRVFVMALKLEEDNDLHVQVAAHAEPFEQEQLVVEIPPGAEYCEARTRMMELFGQDGGTNVRRHIFNRPPQVDVTGYLFLDAAHMRARRTDFCTDNGGRGIRPGRGASPVRGIWELHPVVKLERVGDAPAERSPTPSARVSTQTQGDPHVRVWVNTNSGIYHCPGTRWYGRTKQGIYMTQREAQQKGNRPAYGNVCL